jgi:hypothetical protein
MENGMKPELTISPFDEASKTHTLTLCFGGMCSMAKIDDIKIETIAAAVKSGCDTIMRHKSLRKTADA